MKGHGILGTRRLLVSAALVLVFLVSSLAPLASTAPASHGTEVSTVSISKGMGPRLTSLPQPPSTSPQAAGAVGGASPMTQAAAGSPLPLASPATGSPEVLAGWNALHFGTNGGFGDIYFPPDVQVAAGPSDVVEMVNLLMGIYTKQGTQLGVSSLVTFFNSGSDFISDPKVQYDAASGRWFATVTDVTAGQVLLASSATSDPTGSWHLTRVPSTSAGECLDQPILGVGTTTVIVSVNVFTLQKSQTTPCGSYLGAQYWVVNKTDLVSGVASPATYASAVNSLEGSIHPAQIEGSSSVQYMIATYWPGTATTSNTLHLFAVTGTPPGLVTVTLTSLSMPTAAVPPHASQLGSNSQIDAGDIRVSDAAWAAGKLWLGFDEACLSDSMRACIRMVEVDTTAGSILQDFDIDIAGKDVFYPAFRMDGSGDLAVVFGYSSASDYPGIMATGRLPGDAPNVLQPPSLIAAGTGPEDPSGCTSVCRYGDYFGAGLDPTNASIVWLAGEMGTASGWSTHVFASTVKAILTFDYNIQDGGSGSSAPNLTYVSNGVSFTVPLTTAPTSYYADPSTPWSVDAALGTHGSLGESWPLDELGGSPPFQGLANRSWVANYTYYHQYAVRLGYDVSGASPPFPPASVNVTRFGRVASVLAGQSYALDANSTYAYPSTLGTPSSTGRIAGVGFLTGVVTGPLNLTIHYYQQYRVMFDYVAQVAGTYPAPYVAYWALGANASVQANGTVWADARRTYAYAPSLNGENAGVRIGPGAGATGNVTAPATITVVYQLQYLLRLTVEPGPLFGNVSGAGWYNAGGLATLTASVPNGWAFIGWFGATTGASPSTTLSMGGPENVSALFYPGLTIVAGSGGAVAYAYGTTSGVVPAGGSTTIYAPVGTAVTLTAQPSSWTDAFESWAGAAQGSAPSATFTLTAPSTVSASFGMNALVLAGAFAGVVAIVLAALILVAIARRRRRRAQP